MRVSDRLIFDSATNNAQKARQRHQQAADMASSGLRVSHPGDDPVSAGQIAVHRIAESKHEAIGRALDRADGEIQAADASLGELHNLLVRARELAVQLANDTYSAADRASSAPEVDGLFRSAITILNTEVAGRYVFGGNQDSSPPFDPSGNYLGDSGVRRMEIAPGVLHDASLRADIAIKGAGGGVDVLTTLSSLATALQTNDLAGVRGALSDLTTSIVQVSAGRTQVSSMANVIQQGREAARLGKDAETTALSKEADADAIKAFAELALAERGLEATITAASKSFGMTLLDKL